MRRIIAAVTFLSVCATLAAGCNNPAPKSNQPATAVSTMPANGQVPDAKIAYVNMDTLEAKYELLKTKQEDFKRKQEQMENELQRSYQEMQADAREVQKKAEANTLSQAEYEAAQKRLNIKQQTLQTRKESLTDELMKEQEEFNKNLKSRLSNFLDEYNKTKHYDYILSYSYSGSPLLYVNKSLDITGDVVDGMNAAAKNDESKKTK
jgi:outer membrane protein